MEWWAGREPREKLFLAAGAATLALFVLVQGLLMPTLSARAEARERHDGEARRLASLSRDLAAIPRSAPEAPGAPGGQALSGDALRSALTALARANGLSVSRVQAGAQGRVVIAMEAADPRLVFDWARQSSVQFGARVAAATLTQNGEDRIRVVVEFESGSAL